MLIKKPWSNLRAFFFGKHLSESTVHVDSISSSHQPSEVGRCYSCVTCDVTEAQKVKYFRTVGVFLIILKVVYSWSQQGNYLEYYFKWAF